MARIPRGTIYWVRGDDARINTTYLLDVPISGVTDGQVVRFNGTVYVPALADTFSNSRSLGLIVNVSGSSGDLIVADGLVTGFSGLTPGSFYYLSQSSAGAITSTKPEHGMVVTVGQAVSATSLLVSINVQEANPDIRRGQPQSGCSNGQVVRWNGTNFVPASAADLLNQTPIGIIQNVSGASGDVYFSGLVPTTGMGSLTQGVNYFLSLTAGTMTTTRPINGMVVVMGQALSSTAFYLNISQYYQNSLTQLTPINYAHKEAGLSFWTRISGTGTLAYDSSNISATGYGSYAITGTGVWELTAPNSSALSPVSDVVRSYYPASPLQGMGGFAQFRVNGGTGSLRFGTTFYTRDFVSLSSGLDWWLFNSSTTATTFTYAQAICKWEGGSVGNFPTNARHIRAKVEIVSNPGTIWIDNFTVYPLTFATMALYA